MICFSGITKKFLVTNIYIPLQTLLLTRGMQATARLGGSRLIYLMFKHEGRWMV
jgi:hypothetical protein